MNRKLKLGLALGSGAARGWAHIGIINGLRQAGIEPDIITGTSIGAVVGGAYVAGNLAEFEQWVCSLEKMDIASFFKINTSMNGFINKDKLHKFLTEHLAAEDMLIENLEKSFATVATDLHSGREIWNTKGPIIQAVWASIALPGLFPAIEYDDSWLIDGGLVNPVPVSTCRALGADVVIAVNLNSDLLSRQEQQAQSEIKKTNQSLGNKIGDWISDYTGNLFNSSENETKPPHIIDAIAAAINITQDRITRSRMAGDPPDVLLSPKLGHIGLLEFYQAEQMIAEGNTCLNSALPEIRHLLDLKR